ncbi:MAG TPA: hypothetical protein VJG13_10370 [Thermoanaerobaculia bacterium]|nr:hypothetical protein [Thermoanaerobaculia bacterium]
MNAEHAAGAAPVAGEQPGASDFPPPDIEAKLLASVEDCLAKGRDLKRWWDRVYPQDGFTRRFELGRTFHEPDASFGFFDEAPIGGASRPVMGNFQEMFYDRPKGQRGGSGAPSAAWMRDQIREFVLRYFMRVSDFRAPQGFSESWRPPMSGLFDPLSWCPRQGSTDRGFGFRQLYFKRPGAAEVETFPEEERYAIVDLREIGTTYEWIVVKVKIFDFQFDFAPFGPDLPKIVFPLEEYSYLVVHRDFLLAEDDPEPGVLGRYGFGYAFLKNPEPSAVGYGPGEFDYAIELIDFHVLENGTVRVPMVFVVNRPTRILNLRLDPMRWGLTMANAMTLGLASGLFRSLAAALPKMPMAAGGFDPVYAYIDFARFASGGLAEDVLCISREQLEREFLVKHFMQHYDTISGSLETWRLIPDWLATEELPPWVITGKNE